MGCYNFLFGLVLGNGEKTAIYGQSLGLSGSLVSLKRESSWFCILLLLLPLFCCTRTPNRLQKPKAVFAGPVPGFHLAQYELDKVQREIPNYRWPVLAVDSKAVKLSSLAKNTALSRAGNLREVVLCLWKGITGWEVLLHSREILKLTFQVSCSAGCSCSPGNMEGHRQGNPGCSVSNLCCCSLLQAVPFHMASSYKGFSPLQCHQAQLRSPCTLPFLQLLPLNKRQHSL